MLFKNKRYNIILAVITSLLFIPSVIKAASFSIKSNSYNVAVGSTITVSVSGSDLAGKFTITSSNSSIFSGGGSVWVDKDTQTVKFTAKSAGSVVITVSPTNVADYNGNKITGNKTIIVKSYIPRALESNNYLSSLSIEGVDLVPSFDKETDNYIVDLDPGTTSVKIVAEKANKYASVSGDGEINVVEGNNDINVIVTAENGSKRTYHITAVVKEYDPIKVTVNGSDYTVVRKTSELIKPDNYEETTVTIGDDVVPAFYNSVIGYTLVGLKDVTGNVKLFIYDNGNYSNYLSLSFNKLDLIVLEASKIPRGFIKDTITIDNETVTCYRNNELGIILIYGKSLTTGEENFYVFENSDYTIQKFNATAYNKINKKLDLYMYIIIGLGGINLLILLCLIISSVRNKKRLKHKKDELEKTMSIDTKEVKNKLSKKDKKKIAKEERARKELEKQKEKELHKVEKIKKSIKEKNKHQDLDDNMFQL